MRKKPFMQPSQLIDLHKASDQISSLHVCDDGESAEPQPFHDVVAFKCSPAD